MTDLPGIRLDFAAIAAIAAFVERRCAELKGGWTSGRWREFLHASSLAAGALGADMQGGSRAGTGWFAIAGVAALLLASVGGALAIGYPLDGSQSVGRDEQEVYEAVLRSWLGKAHHHQYVSTDLGPAPSRSDADFRDCAESVRFREGGALAQRHKTLAGIQFKTSDVVLVDPDQWSAVDPGDEIAAGKSVNAAVNARFEHSLISLSQVAFSDDQAIALVKFSMTCGRLCGTGMTVRVSKSGGHWTVSKPCGNEWMS